MSNLEILRQGVLEENRRFLLSEREDESLEGSDNGLYSKLGKLAKTLGCEVVDDDTVTKDILRDGRKGLRKQFASGWVIMVKQGSLLQMSATLNHELAHHFTPSIQNEQDLVFSESVAEGIAFIVHTQFGLDISKQSFPYIAGYNEGIFTTEMEEKIVTGSMWMVKHLNK